MLRAEIRTILGLHRAAPRPPINRPHPGKRTAASTTQPLEASAPWRASTRPVLSPRVLVLAGTKWCHGQSRSCPPPPFPPGLCLSVRIRPPRHAAVCACRHLCLTIFSIAAFLLLPCTLCFIYILRPWSLSPSADPALGTVVGRHRSCFVPMPVPARPVLDLDPTPIRVCWRPGACQTSFIKSFDPLLPSNGHSAGLYTLTSTPSPMV